MAVPLGQEVANLRSVRLASLTWLSCIAVANVCLIRVWTDLFGYPRWPAHRDYDPPQLAHYGAAVLLASLAGSLLWLLMSRVKSTGLQLLIGSAILVVICKEAFLAVSGFGLVQRASLLTPPSLAVILLGIGLIGRQLRRNPGRLRAVGVKLATGLIPVTVLTFGQSAWQATHPSPAASVRKIESALTTAKPPRRVVWVILDELDERVAFTQRRAGVQLPELDRFRREANLVALEARSPQNSTFVSLPALLTFSTDPPQAAHSVMARAKQAGLRTGVVGWALPYCSVLRDWLDVCAWWPVPQQANSYGSGLLEIMAGYTISLFETNQLSLLGQSEAVRHFARTVEEMTVAAAEVAARPDLNLVFLHLPPPHNPYAFNPGTGKIDRAILRFPNPAGYFDNLLLADRVFGRIRRAMEQAGVWENSLVLVTADHGLRSAVKLGYGPDDRHVPFMVKSHPPLPIEPRAPLATARTGDLLLKWLTDHKS